VGVGEVALEFYFIFSDKTRSEIETYHADTEFKESTIKPGQEIRLIQVQSIDREGYWSGCFSGIRFYDADGKVILDAGKIQETGKEYFIQDFTLEKDERLVGIKSNLKE